ncbi:MAG: glycoside hydrolase family 127 protein [Sulfuricurvum sp.]|nr:glycoside hydrolase family 127 protein [Sulfuricurvum sp.]
MKIYRLSAIIGIAVFLFSCGNSENGLKVINSNSFSDSNITLNGALTQRLLPDSVVNISGQSPISVKLDESIWATEKIRKDQSDSLWNAVSASWYDFGKNGLSILSADSASNTDASAIAGKWAELNIQLLKLSGEVRFGDAVEDLLYEFPRLVLTEKQLKSIIYTHIDDQIFINVIGSSSLTHQHTTGGNIKLIQETDYPKSNEMTLKCESNDVRYLDVFIRIPEWAINPTVSYGNVKYVANAGEYCQVSRKWHDGDEFRIVLKN